MAFVFFAFNLCGGCGGYSLSKSAADLPPWPVELTRFRSATSQTVFQAGPHGSWDVALRERGSILKEGEVWKLWFTGYDGNKSSIKRLGLATSPDGLHWQRSFAHPLLENQWIEDCCVVKVDSGYRMMAEGEHDLAHWYSSPDGIHWQPHGKVIVFQTNGMPISPGPYGTPTVWKESDGWRLLYERHDKGVWLAKSSDWLRWEHIQDDPVLIPGPASFEQDFIAVNQVIPWQEWRIAVYHGANNHQQPRLWSTCLARSKDLIHWEKFPENPLRPPSENKSSGQLVFDGTQWRLITTHGKVDVHIPQPYSAER